MTEIYTLSALEKLKKRILLFRILIPLFLFGGLLVCILLCIGVNTGNADARQLAVVLTAVLSGWTAISLLMLGLRPSKARKAHFDGILADSPVCRTGTLVSVGPRLYIPRSITIRKVTVLSDGTEEILNILADRASLLPAPGTVLTFRTVRSYISEIGGLHE